MLIVLKLVWYSKCSMNAVATVLLPPTKHMQKWLSLPWERDRREGSGFTSSDTVCGINFYKPARISTPFHVPKHTHPPHCLFCIAFGSGFYTVEIDVVGRMKEAALWMCWLPDRIRMSPAFCPVLCVILYMVFYVGSCHFSFQEQVVRCTLSKAFGKSR